MDRRPKARSERKPGASAGLQGAIPAQPEQGRRRRHAAPLRSPASARRDTESACGGELGAVEYTGNEPEFEGATWVDADQREAYEAALGRLILAYNEVDYRLSYVLSLALLDRKVSAASTLGNGSFELRLDALAFMRSAGARGLDDVDVEALRRLHHDRNMVTHGHYDENPHDGSHRLFRWRREGPRAIQGYPTERLREIGDELGDHARRLGRLEIWLQFEDLDAAAEE